MPRTPKEAAAAQLAIIERIDEATTGEDPMDIAISCLAIAVQLTKKNIHPNASKEFIDKAVTSLWGEGKAN